MKKTKNPHKTVQLALKIVSIDVGMVSTVNWLNSFYSVFTQWSCEGYDLKPVYPWQHAPYVMFSCYDVNELSIILSKISFGYVVIENYNGNLRYIIRFDSVKSFKDWKKTMRFKD